MQHVIKDRKHPRMETNRTADHSRGLQENILELTGSDMAHAELGT